MEYCYEHGIVSGVSSTEFGRDHSIRRGDFVLMLYNALRQARGHRLVRLLRRFPLRLHYAQAITWARVPTTWSPAWRRACSALPTWSPGSRPSPSCTRPCPCWALSSPEPDLTVLDRFADRDQIAEYARPHAAALVSQGLASGAGGVLNPKGQLARAEMAALLYQLLHL